MAAKSQVLILTLITTLLFLTPYLPISVKSPYLFIIMNVVIVVLGAEAGLLSSFPKPPEEEEPIILAVKFVPPSDTSADKVSTTDMKHAVIPSVNNLDTSADKVSTTDIKHTIISSVNTKIKVIEKFVAEKTVAVCVASAPSLFFIGDEGNTSNDAKEVCIDDDEEEEVGDLSGLELFDKAEMFIENFRNQLKMQREMSWRRIHGFYENGILGN